MHTHKRQIQKATARTSTRRGDLNIPKNEGSGRWILGYLHSSSFTSTGSLDCQVFIRSLPGTGSSTELVTVISFTLNLVFSRNPLITSTSQELFFSCDLASAFLFLSSIIILAPCLAKYLNSWPSCLSLPISGIMVFSNICVPILPFDPM